MTIARLNAVLCALLLMLRGSTARQTRRIVCNPAMSLHRMFNPLQPRQGCLEDEPEQFERCAARRNRQSPIDINTVETVPAQLPPWDFQHYGRNFETVCVFNTGDTVEWILNAPHRPSVAGAGLRGRYILEQIHVHWAGIGRGGSEHQINGESYDLEFHFVHYHERFRNFSEALSSLKLDALVVLGVFVEVSDFYPPHSGIEHLMPDFDVVQFPGSVDVLSGHIHNLQHLLPENKDTFFRYEGSLTSGKHGEVVIWTVFENPIFMSTEQANRFRSVHAANGATICENNRSVQPVNGRLILRNVPLSKASSAETPSWPLFSDLESLLSARNDVLVSVVDKRCHKRVFWLPGGGDGVGKDKKKKCFMNGKWTSPSQNTYWHSGSYSRED